MEDLLASLLKSLLRQRGPLLSLFDDLRVLRRLVRLVKLLILFLEAPLELIILLLHLVAHLFDSVVQVDCLIKGLQAFLVTDLNVLQHLTNVESLNWVKWLGAFKVGDPRALAGLHLRHVGPS